MRLEAAACLGLGLGLGGLGLGLGLGLPHPNPDPKSHPDAYPSLAPNATHSCRLVPPPNGSLQALLPTAPLHRCTPPPLLALQPS